MRAYQDSLTKLVPDFSRSLGIWAGCSSIALCALGMGLFVGVWVARYLGPKQFGSLNFASSFIALFSTATTLGLEGIVIRELLHNPEGKRGILGTSLALRGFGGLLSVGVSVATLRLIQPHDKQSLLLVSILSLTLIFQALDTIDCFFQSEVRSKITVWAKNSAFLVFAGIRVLLIYMRAPVWAFAAAYSGEIALGAVGLVVGYRLSGGRIFSWRVRKATAVALLKDSWPAIFSGLAVMAYMRLDMVMLKMMQGDYAVGIYSAATRVSEVWYFIPTAIVSSVSPALMRAKDAPELFYGRLRKLFSLMTLTACVIGSIVALASHIIVRSLYSNSYSGAGPVLAIHIWASVFVFLGIAQSPWDIVKSLLRLSLYRTIAGAVINVAINFVLIPRYGPLGAAIATVVSYAISAVFANALSSKTRPIFFMQMRSFLPAKYGTSPI